MVERKTYIFDFDSTLISVEAMDQMVPIVCARRGMADLESLEKQISEITNQAMTGDLGFSEALQKRLALLQLLPEDIEKLIPALYATLSHSVKKHLDFFQENRSDIYIISGGFEEYILPVIKDLGISEDHVFANRFVWNTHHTFLTCDTENALSKNQGKLHALRAIPVKGDIIVVGDGYTDYEMKKMGLADRFYLYTEHIDRSDKITEYDACIHSIDELISLEHG